MEPLTELEPSPAQAGGVSRLTDVNISKCGMFSCINNSALNSEMDFVFESFDLREAGLSSWAVSNQGYCGSCWSFATANVLENLVLRSQRYIRASATLKPYWTSPTVFSW